jgi:hypothetical protein
MYENAQTQTQKADARKRWRHELQQADRLLQGISTLYDDESEKNIDERVYEVQHDLEIAKHASPDKVEEISLIQENLQGIAQLFQSAQTQAQKKQAKTRYKKELQKADEYLQGIDKLFQDNKPCEIWGKDKRHNPFNKTKRGPILKEHSRIKKMIDLRCDDPDKFCRISKSKLKYKFCL